MHGRTLHLSTGVVDLDRGEVHRHGELTPLTALELSLLRYLVERPDRVIPREELLAQVWGYRSGTQTRAVDIAMRRLRDKLGEPGRGGHFRTVHGEGYRYSPPEGLVLRAPGLPLPEDALVGRVEELAALDRALRAQRLLILHGPPGIGKTHLALAYGASRLPEYQARGGVWWVPLQQVDQPAGLLAAVAGRLEVPLPPDPAEAARRVGDALAARGPLLLLLDNLDAVADAAAPLLLAWRDQAPAAHLLGTSQRARPDLPVLSIGPLPTEDASALFLARARALRPDFPEAGVPALVTALSGHPLSLVLSAGQARFLDAPALAERAAGPDVPSRVAQAVQVALDRLPPDVAASLAALSVFQGEFSVEAAEAVLGGEALAHLGLLVASALLSPVPPRLRCHESVRRVAARALAQGEQEGEVRRRHAAWLCATVVPQAEQLARSPDAEARQALREEEGDLLGALHPAVPLALRAPITAALVDLWEVLGQEPRALAAIDALGPLDALPVALQRTVRVRQALLLARVGDTARGLQATEALGALPDPLAQAWAAYAAAQIRGKQGALAEAAQLAQQAAQAALAAGDRRLYGMALSEQAVMATTQGDLQTGVARYQEAREVLDGVGDARALGRVLCNLGLLFGLLGRQEAETTLLGQATALLRARGLPKDLANAEIVLATSLGEQGMNDEARATVEQAARRVAALGDPFLRLRTRLVAGEIDRDAGRYAAAEAHLLAGLAEAERLDHRHYRAALLRALGELYDAHGQVERAVGLYGRALEIASGGRHPHVEAQVLGQLAALAADGDRLDLAERVLRSLPEDLDERALLWGHLDLAQARQAPPEQAAAHRARALARVSQARRGGPGQRFTTQNSERMRTALRMLEGRLRSDGQLRAPIEPWVLGQVEALLAPLSGSTADPPCSPPSR